MPHESDCACDYSLKMLIAAIVGIIVLGVAMCLHASYLLHNSTIASYALGSDVITVDDMVSR